MRNASVLNAGILVAALLFSKSVVADEVLVLHFDFEGQLTGYQLVASSSANATADIDVGPVGNSNGLRFEGSWNVPANGQEFAVGGLAPVIPTVNDFQVYPDQVDGIVSLRFTVDLAVISNTMVAPEQGIFAQLLVYQLQEDGTIRAFLDTGVYIIVGESKSVDIVRVESDFGLPGDRPDFSPSGRPFTIAFQLGAQYPREIVPDPFFIDGIMTADNLKVFYTGGLGSILKDGFEQGADGPTEARRAPQPALVVECNCEAPAAAPLLRLD